MRLKIRSILFIVLLFSAPALGYQLSSGNKESADQAVQIVEKYYRFSKAEDLPGYARLYVFNDDKQMRQRLELASAIWEMYDLVDYKLDIKEVAISSEDETATVRYVVQTAHANQAGQKKRATNEMICLLYKGGDGWRIADVNFADQFMANTERMLLVSAPVSADSAYEKQTQVRTFTDTEHGISFSYPASYETLSANNNHAEFSRKLDQKGQELRILWEVKTKETRSGKPDKSTPLDIVNFYKRQVKKLFKTSIHYSKAASYGDMPGAQFSYTINMSKNRRTKTVLDGGTVFYLIDFSAPVDLYQTYLPDYLIVLKSLSAKVVDTKPDVVSPVKPKPKLPVAKPKPVEKPAGMVAYEDKANRVTFLRPREMRIQPKGAKIHFINKTKSAYITYEPMAYQKDGGKYADSLSMCRYLIEQMGKRFQARLKGRIEKISQDGLHGHRIHFVWKMKGQDLEQIEAVLEGPEKLFSFGLLASPRAFPAYWPKFDETMASFRYEKRQLSKPTPPKPAPPKPTPDLREDGSRTGPRAGVELAVIENNGTQKGKKGGTLYWMPKNEIKPGETISIQVESGRFEYIAIHKRVKGGVWRTLYKGTEKEFPFEKYFGPAMNESGLSHFIFSVNGAHERYSSTRCRVAIIKRTGRDPGQGPKPAGQSSKKEHLRAVPDAGPVGGILVKKPVAVLFRTKKTGAHTIQCNSMAQATVIMILYDAKGKKLGSNIKDKKLYKGFRRNLKRNQDYFFLVAPFKKNNIGKPFRVQVTTD